MANLRTVFILKTLPWGNLFTDMTDISVIIPVYNTEKYLEKCVLSVLEGGVENIEILLIDDGSDDGSGHLCDRLAEKSGKIKVFHKENGGLSSSRNLGISKAKGKYLCFIDSDDFLEKNSLFNMLKKAESQKAEISVFGLIIDIPNSYKKFVSDGDYTLTQENKDSHFISLKEKCLLDSCCNKLYLTSFVKKSGITFPFREYFEDTYFNLMLWERFSKCAVFDDCYYHYVKRKTKSLTRNFDTNKLKVLKSRVSLMLNVTKGLEDFCYYYYVKYVLSVLCDSFIKGANILKPQRKALIKKEINSDEFKGAAKKAKADTKSGKLLVSVAKSGFYPIIFIFLRLSCFIKYNLIEIYFKVVRI